MDRYARQVMLTEVGPSGQARLAGACVEVGVVGFAGEVAVRYLAGAGVGRLRVGDIEIAAVARAANPDVSIEVVPDIAASAVDGLDLVDPVARQVAGGSLAALRAVRAALAAESAKVSDP